MLHYCSREFGYSSQSGPNVPEFRNNRKIATALVHSSSGAIAVYFLGQQLHSPHEIIEIFIENIWPSETRPRFSCAKRVHALQLGTCCSDVLYRQKTCVLHTEQRG